MVGTGGCSVLRTSATDECRGWDPGAISSVGDRGLARARARGVRVRDEGRAGVRLPFWFLVDASGVSISERSLVGCSVMLDAPRPIRGRFSK